MTKHPWDELRESGKKLPPEPGTLPEGEDAHDHGIPGPAEVMPIDDPDTDERTEVNDA